ncbi:MAG: hypothetical protein ACP5NS_03145 [Candidatus Pacearchaeota archaeon]
MAKVYGPEDLRGVVKDCIDKFIFCSARGIEVRRFTDCDASDIGYILGVMESQGEIKRVPGWQDDFQKDEKWALGEGYSKSSAEEFAQKAIVYEKRREWFEDRDLSPDTRRRQILKRYVA